MRRSSFSPTPQGYFPEDVSVDDIARRRQRIQELEELEMREQEYALRQKEKDIRERARELEREQMELMSARQNRLKMDLNVERSRPQAGSRPDSSDSPSTPVQSHHPYASSSTSQAPLSPPSPRYPQHPSSQPPSPMFQQSHSQSSDHAASCGCETCSASKYASSSPRPRGAEPAAATPATRPEKPRGWIRRLSMPVIGNALSDNNKPKGISNADVSSHPFYRSSLGLPEEDGRLRPELKNRSVTNLVRR